MPELPAWQETTPDAPTTPEDEAVLTRGVVIAITVVGALYAIAILADWYGLQFLAGRLSLVLFVAGSVWTFGFLILRTLNQAATESYDLERATLLALHTPGSPDAPSSVGEVAERYATLARRHESITETRSYSAALALYGTAFSGVAGATVLVGITGWWGLFDFFAVVLLAGAVLVHLAGPGHSGAFRHLGRALPPRWR
ncbi:MAG TPA: hypothetical protein VMG99_01100 [Thermoplasmata archaeon]|nr:hypothetical protein [Thermoplasmata archaeon]HTW55454.1 hypothetical protein [Thermoplasmata archaeon]